MRWEQALRRSGGCCATASCAGEGSLGGSRFVWVPSRKGVDEFLSQYGRLDGRRGRPARRTVADVAARARPVPRRLGHAPRGAVSSVPAGARRSSSSCSACRCSLAYAAAQILPGRAVVPRARAARRVPPHRGGEGRALARWSPARSRLVMGATSRLRSRAPALPGRARSVSRIVAASLVVASVLRVVRRRALADVPALAASAALRRRRIRCPARTSASSSSRSRSSSRCRGCCSGSSRSRPPRSVLVYRRARRARGSGRFARPTRPRCTSPCSPPPSCSSWRGGSASSGTCSSSASPRPAGSDSFAGAGYVDVHVRSPGLAALSILAVVCGARVRRRAAHGARRGHRRARAVVGRRPGGRSRSSALVSVGVVAPGARAAVRRRPEPAAAASSPSWSDRSRRRGAASGSTRIEVHPYSPTGRLQRGRRLARSRAARGRSGLGHAGARGEDARPRHRDALLPPARSRRVDIVRVDGRRQLTVASARELDLRRAGGGGRSWANDRLAYTHGLGLPRFSATDIEPGPGSRGCWTRASGMRQPRIYFGDLPARSRRRRGSSRTPAGPRSTSRARGATAAYHYDGTGRDPAVELDRSEPCSRSRWGARTCSSRDDITPESRILLHRDVRDRLATLAPFIRWDSHPAPLAVDGRIVFVVDGYTTSANYPYAERVELGGAPVSYARASVRATVDAFSGRVELYLTERADPIARAWAEAFPTLFRPRGRDARRSCATGCATRPTSSRRRRPPTSGSTPRDRTCSRAAPTSGRRRSSLSGLARGRGRHPVRRVATRTTSG